MITNTSDTAELSLTSPLQMQISLSYTNPPRIPPTDLDLEEGC
jgi:hypothetical protein